MNTRHGSLAWLTNMTGLMQQHKVSNIIRVIDRLTRIRVSFNKAIELCHPLRVSVVPLAPLHHMMRLQHAFAQGFLLELAKPAESYFFQQLLAVHTEFFGLFSLRMGRVVNDDSELFNFFMTHLCF